MNASTGASVDAVEPAPESPRQQTPGALLQQAREQRGLNVQQIADELHLDVRVVQALESDNFLTLGAPVYAKGHLRKYALLLGISPQAVLASYEKLTDVPVTPTVIPVSTVQAPPSRISLRIPALIVAGVFLAGALFWSGLWLVDRFGSRTPAAASAPSQIQVPVAASAAAAPEILPESPDGATQSIPIPATPAASAAQVEDQSTASQAAAPPPAASVSLRLSFNEASWVEVYDATEQRLAYGIGQAGQTRAITGAAPLRVTLGMASAVSLDVNERAMPVPRRAGRDASRFTVFADGSVR